MQAEQFIEAVRFYKCVLGFPITYESDTLVGFETGSFCLYIEPGPGYGPVFEFEVADLEAVKKELIDAGCRVEQEDTSVPRCYLRDRFGLTFNLSERKTND